MSEWYRISYYTGVQTLRLVHRFGRLLTLLFSPLWVLLRRISAFLTAHRGRTLRAKLRTFGGYFVQAARRMRDAAKGGPLCVLRQLVQLPMQAIARYRHIVTGVATVAFVAVAVFVLQATLRYWSEISFALALTDADGDVWGYVSEEAELYAGIAMANERLESTNVTLEAVATPDVSLHMIPQASLLTKEAICDRLLGTTAAVLADACGVYVDGIFRGAVTNRSQAQRVLQNILEENRAEHPDTQASFFEDVQLVDGRYPIARLLSDETLAESLKTGDSHVRVLISGTEQYEVEVPFTIERVADASKNEGYERVRVKGVNGVSRVTAEVTYLDGQQLSGTIVSTEVIREPITQVVAYGTKTKDQYSSGGGNATGRFVWPVETTRFVSQYFGGHSGKHGGLDIWSRDMTGEGILAADGGTVVIAEDPKGTSYWSYGKYVVIDHGGGYQTLYAHCNELFVKAGEKVTQGQRIAAVGNTGRSTAPHLHFEIRYNGRTVNPMKFF